MRIFVLTAIYELRGSRKTHLRDHPTCNVGSCLKTHSSLLHDAIMNAKELVIGAETDLEPGGVQEEFTMLCKQNFADEFCEEFHKLHMLTTPLGNPKYRCRPCMATLPSPRAATCCPWWTRKGTSLGRCGYRRHPQGPAGSPPGRHPDLVSRVGTRCKPSSDNGSRIARAVCADGGRPVDDGLVQSTDAGIQSPGKAFRNETENGARGCTQNTELSLYFWRFFTICLHFNESFLTISIFYSKSKSDECNSIGFVYAVRT
jgi:hypothetical protein